MSHRPPSRLFIVLVAACILATSASPTAAQTGAGGHSRDRAAPIRSSSALGRVLGGGLAALAENPSAATANGIAGSAVGPRGRTPWRSLKSHQNGSEIAVSIRFSPEQASSAANAIASVGGRVISTRAGVSEAYVAPAALRRLAALPGIVRADPIVDRRMSWYTSAAQLQGQTNWGRYGFDGIGIKVGIIDDGFANIGALLAGQAHWRCYSEIGTFVAAEGPCDTSDHGALVARTVAVMAPRAELYLANPISPEDEIATVDWMISEGVKIINASWTDMFLDGPGDGTSPYTDSYYSLVNRAVEGGVLWVNASGNDALENWTGQWRDANNDKWLDFSTAYEDNPITLQKGEDIAVSLRWDDPWGRSANDFDLALFAPTGSTPVAASTDVQDGTGEPIERLMYEAPAAGTYYVAVYREHAVASSHLQVVALTTHTSPLKYRNPASSLLSPADSANPGMVSVGAVGCDGSSADCGDGTYSPSQIEPYSARGPTADGRVKPDLTAEDCTTVGANAEAFCGTSQSAPFVAGGAALLLQADPSLTPAALAQQLRERAAPLSSVVPSNTFGAGRLDVGAPPGRTPSLHFSYAPPTGIAAGAWSAATFEVRYDDGSVVNGGRLGNGLPVTLSLPPNAGGAELECGVPGMAAESPVTSDGRAMASPCWVTAPATGLTLVASVPGLEPAMSEPFDVGPRPSTAPRITAAATPTITWGSATAITATLRDVAGHPMPAKYVVFEVSLDRKGWSRFAAPTTSTDGVARTSYRPATNVWIRAVFPGAGQTSSTQTLPAVTSAPVRVVVRQIALLRPDNLGKTRTVTRGTAVTFTTTLRPFRPELTRPVAEYRVYRLIGTSWTLYRDIKVAADSQGVATLRWTFSSSGKWYVRSMAVPTAMNANSIWSPVQRYDVR